MDTIYSKKKKIIMSKGSQEVACVRGGRGGLAHLAPT